MLPMSASTNANSECIVFDNTEKDYDLYSVDLELLVQRLDVDRSMLVDLKGCRYYTHMDTIRLIYELSNYDVKEMSNCSISVNRLLTELAKLPVYPRSRGHYSYRCYSYTMLRRFLLSTAFEQRRGWRKQLMNVDLTAVVKE